LLPEGSGEDAAPGRGLEVAEEERIVFDLAGGGGEPGLFGHAEAEFDGVPDDFRGESVGHGSAEGVLAVAVAEAVGIG